MNPTSDAVASPCKKARTSPVPDREKLINFVGWLLGHIVDTNAYRGKFGRVVTGNEELRRQLVDHLDQFHLTSVNATSFVQRLDKYMQCSCAVYVTSLVLLDKLSSRVGLCLDRTLFCQLFFGCFLLARKMLEDGCIDIRYCAQVGGFLPHHPGGEQAGIQHLKRLELLLCQCLDWDLFVPEYMFWHYSYKVFRSAGVDARVLDEERAICN